MTRRTPGTAERAAAKALLRRAEAGEPDAAEVLVDALILVGHAEAAESLAFALRGRAYADLGPDDNYPWGFVRGAPLPSDLAPANQFFALSLARRHLFPIRKAPCLPSVAAVRRLFVQVYGADEASGRAVRARERVLWQMLGGACDADVRSEPVRRTIAFASSVLHGEGLAWFDIRLRRGPRVVSVDYVNFGDAEAPTLLFDFSAYRFRVMSLRAIIELYERRFGEPDPRL